VLRPNLVGRRESNLAAPDANRLMAARLYVALFLAPSQVPWSESSGPSSISPPRTSTPGLTEYSRPDAEAQLILPLGRLWPRDWVGGESGVRRLDGPNHRAGSRAAKMGEGGMGRSNEPNATAVSRRRSRLPDRLRRRSVGQGRARKRPAQLWLSSSIDLPIPPSPSWRPRDPARWFGPSSPPVTGLLHQPNHGATDGREEVISLRFSVRREYSVSPGSTSVGEMDEGPGRFTPRDLRGRQIVAT